MPSCCSRKWSKTCRRRTGRKNGTRHFTPHRTQHALSESDISFIQARDSFYMATVNSDCWPYMQHRGGARGFVHVAGAATLACADYVGNKQFISQGNLQTDDRVSLFFMDYMNHGRLKVQGQATLVAVADADLDVVACLDQSIAPAERVLTVQITAMDWSCPKYIPTLFSEDAVRQVVGGQIGQLQVENAVLRTEIARLTKA